MSAAALRIPSHVLRWMLVLGPILVLVLAFKSLWTLRAATAHLDPDEMSIVADRVAQLVDAYLARIVGTTSSLVIVPDVASLAAEQSARPLTPEDALTEKNWKRSANTRDDPFLRLEKEAVSWFLRDLTAAEGGVYREILLADAEGRLIAASNRTEDFRQNDKDDPWWPANLKLFTDSCRRVPLKCVRMTDVGWDQSAATFGYDVVLPVVTRGKQAVGVLKAVVDPRELEALLRFATLNSEVDVALINAQGMRFLTRERFFTEGATEAEDQKEPSSRLRALAPGGETSWPLAEKGPAVYVRRLSSPVEEGWFIAVTDRDHDDSGAWKTYVLWCLFTLGMFVIAAGAFAVKGPGPAEAPAEREVAL